MMTPYERVKLSRQRTDGAFPLPSPVDCLRYAICEIAEYDDALLRLERAGDKRNNDRQHDPAAELGQALYMLLSACVQRGHQPRAGFYVHGPTPRSAYAKTLGVLASMLDNHFAFHVEDLSAAYTHIVVLAARHSWDVDALIDATCAKFEAKHAPEVQP